MGQLQLPDKEMPAGPLIPTPRPGQYHATGTGDSSSGALSNFRTLPENRIILKKISSSKHQPARAALYKWENGHKREAPGAGLAVCPATGTGPSQDHTPPWGQEPSGTGKVQVQHGSGNTAVPASSPQLSPARAAPQKRSPSASPQAVASHHSLSPPPAQRGCTMALPNPTTMVACTPQHGVGTTLHHSGDTSQYMKPTKHTTAPHSKGCGGARYSWGQAGHLGRTVRECWNTETSRDQPCSTPKC